MALSRRRSGSIWLIKAVGGMPDSPVRRICSTQAGVRTGNNTTTSNYSLSLKNKRSVVYKELRAQMSVVESGKQSAKTGWESVSTNFILHSKTQPHDRNGIWWTELIDLITYWIAKVGLPLYVVEKSCFKKMIDVFDPKYDVQSGKDRHSSSLCCIP